MFRALSARTVHRTLIARGFAILLVVLVVLPFTAPFSTCDLAEVAGAPSSGKELSPGWHDTDVAFFGPLESAVPAMLPTEHAGANGLATMIATSPIPHSVLRL